MLLWSSPPWEFCIPAHDWSCEAALLSPPCSSPSTGGGHYTPGQSRQALGLLPTPWGHGISHRSASFCLGAFQPFFSPDSMAALSILVFLQPRVCFPLLT